MEKLYDPNSNENDSTYRKNAVERRCPRRHFLLRGAENPGKLSTEHLEVHGELENIAGNQKPTSSSNAEYDDRDATNETQEIRKIEKSHRVEK
jgi:hypothetical protein